MTPELRQAIAILQLSTQELISYVDQQLAENPLLESFEEGEAKGTGDKDKEKLEQGQEPSEERVLPSEESRRSEINWQEYFHDVEDGPSGRAEEYEVIERPSSEPFITPAPTLQEYLLEQLNLQKGIKDEIVRYLVEYIAGNLDERGYMILGLEDIAAEQNVPLDDVRQALEIVQGFEPAGVGARSLKECLSLQLHLLPECPPEMPEFLYYLEDLAAGRIQKIANALKISLSKVTELANLVRKLNPKPGLRFSDLRDVRYIIPDILIEEMNGEFMILINDVSIPRLRINHTYLKVLKEEKGTETRKFVENKLNAAAWFIRSVEQRRMTLYKIANAMIRRQENFLRYGISQLKPLTLKDIAEEVGVHESTVSRATANKYMQTSRGIFDMKFFFATGVNRDSDLTAEGIKTALKEIIITEDRCRPNSDQKLAEILSKKGMNISRRTVAKYRDEMGLPPASVRKRF
jgi:RNA polymerase sigma-54 factor